MSLEVEETQNNSALSNQYRKKRSKMEVISQEKQEILDGKQINFQYLSHISSGVDQQKNLLANNKSLLITKKLSKLKLHFSSMKRKIDSLTSTINDFQFIVSYIGSPNYPSYPTLSSDNYLQSDVLSMKQILEKKERKCQAKLAKLKTEKNDLMEKKYKLISQKDQFENRKNAATKILDGKIEDLGFMEEMGQQIDKEIEFANEIQQTEKLNCSVQNENHDNLDDKDDVLQQIRLQDERLTKITQRKELLIEKLNEIKLMKEDYQNNHQMRLNYNYFPKPNFANRQEIDEEESDGIDYEKYEQMIHKQRQIDEQSKEIEKLIEINMSKRKEIENKYEEKIKKVSELSDKTSEIDRLQIQIHRINDQIIDAKESLSQNTLTKNRLLRQNGTIVNSLEKSKKENSEVQKTSLEIQKKQEQVNKRSLSIQNRRKRYDQNALEYEKESNILATKKAEVEKLELKMTELEEKIEEVNEEIKMQSSFVDKLLFNASASRADSRISRLQALLDSRSENEIDLKDGSGQGFDSKFLYDSPSKY